MGTRNRNPAFSAYAYPSGRHGPVVYSSGPHQVHNTAPDARAHLVRELQEEQGAKLAVTTAEAQIQTRAPTPYTGWM